ncbi:MAG: YihY/virulence factor BrkB family protein [Bowdeniella nasicola]|nr:YihY/virulence factor BrkB family protein [Bowdeniella nasicola]
MSPTEKNPRIDESTVVAVEKTPLKELLADEDSMGGKLGALVTWFKATRLGRASTRLTVTSGFYLAGGIAYAALFSIFAALAIGFTAFMAVLGGNDELLDQVIDSTNKALPGIIDDGSNGGMVKPEQLVQDTAINLTSIISVVVLLWSAIAVMTALRLSIQRMFGVVGAPVNFVMGKVKDLAGFAIIALAVLATSILGLAAGTLGGAVLDWLGIEGAVAGFLLRTATFLAAFLVDWGVFIFLFRVTAGMRPPTRDLLIGSAVGALASSILRYLGTSVVGSAADNPILASAAAVVTLLLWVNLLARVTLFVAAWIANPPAAKMPETPEELHHEQTPNFVTLSVPETLNWDFQAITGALNPNPELNPNARPKPADQPYWGGLIGAAKQHRIDRLERKLAKARAGYYRGEAPEDD